MTLRMHFLTLLLLHELILPLSYHSSSQTHSIQFIQNQPFTSPNFDNCNKRKHAIEAGNHSQFITNITTNNNRENVRVNQRLGGTILYDTHMPNPNSIAVPKEALDSGLTGNNNNYMGLPLSRKRWMDYYLTPNESSTVTYGFPCNNNDGGKPRLSSSWFEQEAVLQMQRQQRELDCVIAQHTWRLRVELEQRVKQQVKALASAIREAVSTKLREKDEEIQRVVKMNWALQERIRNLCVENQLWMGLAQSNEAVANSLRNDLEQVLTGTTRKVEEDEESCCGSNEVEEEESGRCKGCGGWPETAEEDAMVMPCRHFFLMCTRCKLSSRQSCPVCRSSITSTLHVHLPPKSNH